MNDRPCLICNRREDDPLHLPEPRKPGRYAVTPRIDQHAYDPGERRQYVRRMADRVRLVQEATEDVETAGSGPERRRADRRAS